MEILSKTMNGHELHIELRTLQGLVYEVRLVCKTCGEDWSYDVADGTEAETLMTVRFVDMVLQMHSEKNIG